MAFDDLLCLELTGWEMQMSTQNDENFSLQEAEKRLCSSSPNIGDGWVKVCLSSEDGERVGVLNDIYTHHEPPNLSDEETPYNIPKQPPPGFTAQLLWVSGTAVGFALVLEKGMMTSDGPMEFNTLDGIFIRKLHRKQGWATKLIENIYSQYLNEDLAFSLPLSSSLWHVLSRLVKEKKQLRDKLWAIHGTGAEGDRFNVALELKRRKFP